MDKARAKAKVVTIVEETGATITLEVVINKDTVEDLSEITSTPAAGLHPTVVIWVLVAVNPETRDGYRPSVDKVASLLLKMASPNVFYYI